MVMDSKWLTGGKSPANYLKNLYLSVFFELNIIFSNTGLILKTGLQQLIIH